MVLNGRFLAQVQTGVQRYALETLLALDRLLAAQASGHIDWVLALPDGAAAPALSAIRCQHLPGQPGHGWEQWTLWRFARGAYLVNFNYSGPLLKRWQLVTVHDATVRVMPQAFTRAYRWVHNCLVGVLGRSAHTVMTVSEFSRDELQRCFGLRRNDILVGREGGEHAALASDDAAVLRRHGLVAGGFILGVGSVKPNKNYALLGRAMRLLPNYPWPVAIAGAKDIGIFQDAAALPDGFQFLGFVPDAELAALYRQAAWFVFPSSYEGFGLPAVEAMANGCPVLAARAASIPEVCGDAALYFDPQDPASLADVLRTAAADRGLRPGLVAAGRARLLRYNWQANAQILLDHLQTSLVTVCGCAGAASQAKPALTAMPASTPPADAPKIIHATECLAAGTLTFLAQATRELAEIGVEQAVVFARRPDTPADVEALFDPRITLIEIAPPRGLHLHFLRDLRRALLQQMQAADAAVVHLHSSKAGFLGRLALWGLRNRPASFYSPHGLSFLNRKQRLRSAVFKSLEWLGARVDTTLVGCSRSEAALLGQLGPRNARVLENAVDDSFFAVRRHEDAPPLVLSIGRVCFQKAPERFAALATRFQIAELPARFVWVGAGDADGEARLRAAGVEVTGWVDRDTVQQLLGAAAVYVQTSRWEGMPLSVLQALAAGVPCVVNDAVGNRDAVRQGLTGFVTSSLDELLMAVRRVLQDDTLRRRMGAAARRDALERFSAASFRARLCRLYGLPLREAQPALVAPDNLLRFPRVAGPSAGDVDVERAQPRPRQASGD